MKGNYRRALQFPIVAAICAYALIAINVKLYPTMVVTGDILAGYAFLNVSFTLVGAWPGYRIVDSGGNFLDVILVGAIIAAVVGALQLVQGVFVGLPVLVNLSAELSTIVYNAYNSFFGALIAGGFALAVKN